MKIIIITGQTATGKTSYALKLAERYSGELINCDSRQIYKKLNIITGKDLTDNRFHLVTKRDSFDIGYYELSTSDLRFRTKVWLYDIVDPKQNFSSFDYQQCALWTIRNILERNKCPVIVGGTYFYIKHLLYEIATQNIKPDWDLRKKLANKTVEELQSTLFEKSKIVFESLNNSDKNNPQRLIRKIEIVDSEKQLNTENTCTITLSSKLSFDKSFDVEYIGLKNDTKNTLHTKIDERVEQRIHAGAIQEVEHLLKEGYKIDDPGLKTIGYQQVNKYLNKAYSKEEMIKEWVTKEKQYAKRQYTFMKKDPNIMWRII